MPHHHAVVWIDHHKATAWHFSATEQEEKVIHAKDQHEHAHSRRTTHGRHASVAEHQFFNEVAKEIDGVQAILLIGPAHTKQEFAAYLNDKHPQLGKAVVAVENADHPTDAQVLSYARRHFPALDRMVRG